MSYNAIVDAADSLRAGWEIHKSEIRHLFPPNHWSTEMWRQEAITYVTQLMAGELKGNIIAIAGRLLSG